MTTATTMHACKAASTIHLMPELLRALLSPLCSCLPQEGDVEVLPDVEAMSRMRGGAMEELPQTRRGRANRRRRD